MLILYIYKSFYHFIFINLYKHKTKEKYKFWNRKIIKQQMSKTLRLIFPESLRTSLVVFVQMLFWTTFTLSHTSQNISFFFVLFFSSKCLLCTVVVAMWEVLNKKKTEDSLKCWLHKVYQHLHKDKNHLHYVCIELLDFFWE